LGTFGRETSKEECSEKMRKGPATNVVGTRFWYTRQQIEGINGTSKTLGM